MSDKKNQKEKPYEWIKKWEPTLYAFPDELCETNMPVLKEPKIFTMDKKVIIEAAVTGWQPTRWWRERGVNNLPPGTRGKETCVQDQADAIVECVKAGAACIHVHPRHPEHGKSLMHDAVLTADIFDRAFEEVDFITTGHSFNFDFRKGITIEYNSSTMEFLRIGKGNKYIQTALIPTFGCYLEQFPVITDEANREGIKLFEENGIKPLFSIEPYYFSHFKRGVLDTGVAKSKPYFITLVQGKHKDDLQFGDPWSYLNTITTMGLVRAVIPEEDLLLGIHPAGRNWLPVSVVSLLYGAQYIRVGIEDLFFLWPHRDEISTKVSTSVEMIVQLCKLLGREVATVDEAREIIGVKRTS